MTVTLDEKLLVEAQKALGTSSKVETIRQALSLALRRKRLNEALARRGTVALDLDQAHLAKLREEG